MTLSRGMAGATLSYQDLWLNYVSVGGSAGALEVEAYVLGLLEPGMHQHNLIAQALNERYLDLGLDHPVEYWAPKTAGPS